jgi:hypothetical protein
VVEIALVTGRNDGWRFAWAIYCFSVLMIGFFATQPAHSQAKPSRIEGPNACVECHKKEGDIWKKSHHYSTFRDMPRSKEARAIAKKMKIKRMKSSKLCLGCHFTTRKAKKKTKAIAGISCESCHAEGRDYIKVHAEFSGQKNKDSESKTQAATRWEKSEAAGMIRPKSLYKLAKNCYSCHVVPRENLVNIGGHTAGSKFELYSWSQGEVRHNVWYSKENTQANINRRRMMYVVGLAVELETALRAVGLATKKKAYAVRMAQRAEAARKKLAAVAKALPNVPEIAKIVRLGYSAGLKLNNNKALSAAADSIARQAKKFLGAHNGDKLSGIDGIIPSPENFRGTPAE